MNTIKLTPIQKLEIALAMAEIQVERLKLGMNERGADLVCNVRGIFNGAKRGLAITANDKQLESWASDLNWLTQKWSKMGTPPI